MSPSDKRIVSITDHLSEHQQKRIGKQTMTRDEVAELITEVYGPLAALLREVCVRQQALEDCLQLAFDPVTGEFAPAVAASPELPAVVEAPVMDMGEGWEGGDPYPNDDGPGGRDVD